MVSQRIAHSPLATQSTTSGCVQASVLCNCSPFSGFTPSCSAETSVPPCFFAVSDDEWDSLVLIRLKVDFKTIKAGRSPVVSKQKLEVVRGVWVSTLPMAIHLSGAAASALRFLLRSHAAYRCYWEKLQKVLDKSLPRTLPTAEFLLRMPGVEVALRPWLYPTDLPGHLDCKGTKTPLRSPLTLCFHSFFLLASHRTCSWTVMCETDLCGLRFFSDSKACFWHTEEATKPLPQLRS